MDILLEPSARFALATLCVAVLIAARWRHEQQLAELPPVVRPGLTSPFSTRAVAPLRVPRPARGLRGLAGGRELRRSRAARHPGTSGFSLALYWMGLTSSAALAGQAIATLLGPAILPLLGR